MHNIATPELPKSVKVARDEFLIEQHNLVFFIKWRFEHRSNIYLHVSTFFFFVFYRSRFRLNVYWWFEVIRSQGENNYINDFGHGSWKILELFHHWIDTYEPKKWHQPFVHYYTTSIHRHFRRSLAILKFCRVKIGL